MADATGGEGGAPVLSPHDQAMVDKVDANQKVIDQNLPTPIGGNQAEPAKPAAAAAQRPENVPEKFWDAEKGVVNTEALLKSYTELEKGKAAPLTPEAQKAADDAAAAAKAAGATGIDFTKGAAEFAEKGELSAETRADYVAKGIPAEYIDAYLDGLKSKAQLADYQIKEARNEVFSLVGGEEKYTAMGKWAAANMNDAELAAFNAGIESTDPAKRKQAAQSLKSSYEAAMGRDPNLVGGEGAASLEGAFENNAQVTAAIRDPRYHKDPAYRASVERRIGLMP